MTIEISSHFALLHRCCNWNRTAATVGIMRRRCFSAQSTSSNCAVFASCSVCVRCLCFCSVNVAMSVMSDHT